MKYRLYSIVDIVGIMITYLHRRIKKSRSKNAEVNLIPSESIPDQAETIDLIEPEVSSHREPIIDQAFVESILSTSIRAENSYAQETAENFIKELRYSASLGNLHFGEYCKIPINTSNGFQPCYIREDTSHNYLRALSRYLPSSFLFIRKQLIYFRLDLGSNAELIDSQAGLLLSPVDIFRLLELSRHNGELILRDRARISTDKLAENLQIWADNGGAHLIPFIEVETEFPFTVNKKVAEVFRTILLEYIPVDRITVQIYGTQSINILFRISESSNINSINGLKY